MKFNDLSWHDAIVKNIIIDRNNPGIEDTIKLQIQWPDEDQTAIIVFKEVYWALLNLNFGVVTNESLLSALELEDCNQYMSDLRSAWKGLIDGVELKTYQFHFNSTASEVVIIARNCEAVLPS